MLYYGGRQPILPGPSCATTHVRSCSSGSLAAVGPEHRTCLRKLNEPTTPPSPWIEDWGTRLVWLSRMPPLQVPIPEQTRPTTSTPTSAEQARPGEAKSYEKTTAAYVRNTRDTNAGKRANDRPWDTVRWVQPSWELPMEHIDAGTPTHTHTHPQAEQTTGANSNTHAHTT